MIWLHAARAAGWDSHGVDFPSHFLVALEGRKTQVVVDVFNGGQVMSARELRALLKRVEGDERRTASGDVAADEHAAGSVAVAEQHHDPAAGSR